MICSCAGCMRDGDDHALCPRCRDAGCAPATRGLGAVFEIDACKAKPKRAPAKTTTLPTTKPATAPKPASRAT